MKESKYNFGGLEGDQLEPLVNGLVNQAQLDGKLIDLRDYATAILIKISEALDSAYCKCWHDMSMDKTLPPCGIAFIYRVASRPTLEELTKMLNMAREVCPSNMSNEKFTFHTFPFPHRIAIKQRADGVTCVTWGADTCPPGYTEVDFYPSRDMW
jgi:hypothetical protein